MRVLCYLLLLALPAVAADWPQFLGPERSGIAAAAEPALPDKLPSDLTPLWRKSAGAGFAGPAVVKGRVILFHREGSDMVTEALDAVTGAVLWRSSYISDYVDSFGFDNGPRAVPTVAGERVFVHGPEGRVTALDFASGKELWAYDTASAVKSAAGFFGRAASPLVIGNQVLVAAGGMKDGEAAGLIALDAATGQLRWNAVEDEAGYASPVSLGGDEARSSLLAWMRNRLWLVDAQAGKVVDSVQLRSKENASVNAATPIRCGNGRWFVSAGYGVGANVFEIPEVKPSRLKQLWTQQDLLDCHYSTPVYLAGCVYGFHGRQETGQNLRCIDLETQTVRWESPQVPGGTLLLVGDKLLVVTEQGELWLVRASPDKFEQLAAIQILRSGHRSHAAFADGVLYARDTEHLVAVKVR